MKKNTIYTALLLAAGMIVVSEPAFAQAGGGINLEGVLQNIITLLTGAVARSLAVIAIVIAGIATMFGRLEMQRFGVLVAGMALIFGAATFVDMIVGS